MRLRLTVTIFIFVITALLFTPPILAATPVRGMAGDGWADLVLGQPDFGQAIPKEITNFKVAGPGGTVVDRTIRPNRVYIYDGMNSRVLGYSHLGVCKNDSGQQCTTDSDCPNSTCRLQIGGVDGAVKADLVIGQPGFNTSACNGDGAFWSYPEKAKASANTLCSMPQGSASMFESGSFASMDIDSEGNLYVPDFFNHRVLKYIRPFETDTTADEVWGQENFQNNQCNQGKSSPDNKTICFFAYHSPTTPSTGGVDIDKTGNLWVADSENNRVLRFPNLNGEISKTADIVIGQQNFTSRNISASLSGLYTPTAVRVNNNGDVYVADTDNHRVLVYHPPISSGMAGALFAGNFKKPTGIEFDPPTGDPSGGGVWISDTDNKQLVLFGFDGIPKKTLFKDTYRPDGICGNPGMVCPGPGGKDTCNMCDARGSIGITADGDVIVASSTFNQDVNFYKHPIPAMNPGHPYPAIAQFFNPPYFHNYRHSKGFLSPRGIAFTGQQLIIGDSDRIVFWNTRDPLFELKNDQPADGAIGVDSFDDFNKNQFQRIAADKNNLWVLAENSLQRFSLPLTAWQKPNQSVSLDHLKILGQKDIINVFLRPTGIWADPQGRYLWIALPTHSRVIRVRIPPGHQGDYLVDIIVGGEGIPESDMTWHRPCPSSQPLCAPGSVSEDHNGNLYISDYHLENEGSDQKGRFLQFDKSLFPVNNPSLLTYDTTSAARIFKFIYGWQPAFDSKNQMVIGFAEFITDRRFPYLYSNILSQSPPFLQADKSLKDFYSQAYTPFFDNNDNLYYASLNRGRVLIYKTPFTAFGDLNKDSRVDEKDLKILLNHYRKKESLADLNGDKAVNMVDAGLVMLK